MCVSVCDLVTSVSYSSHISGVGSFFAAPVHFL